MPGCRRRVSSPSASSPRCKELGCEISPAIRSRKKVCKRKKTYAAVLEHEAHDCSRIDFSDCRHGFDRRSILDEAGGGPWAKYPPARSRRGLHFWSHVVSISGMRNLVMAGELGGSHRPDLRMGNQGDCHPRFYAPCRVVLP